MLSKLLCAKRRKSHNSTKYCESIIKSAGIKQMAIQHHRYDQHLSQFWKHLVTYFRTGRPIQTNNSNCIGGGRTTPTSTMTPPRTRTAVSQGGRLFGDRIKVGTQSSFCEGIPKCSCTLSDILTFIFQENCWKGTGMSH